MIKEEHPICVLVVRPNQTPTYTIVDVEYGIIGIMLELNRLALEDRSPQIKSDVHSSQDSKNSLKYRIYYFDIDEDLSLYYIDDDGSTGLPLNRIIDGTSYYGSFMIVGKNSESEYKTISPEDFEKYYHVFNKKEIPREEIPYLLYKWFDEHPGSFEKYVQERMARMEEERERQKKNRQKSFYTIEFDEW